MIYWSSVDKDTIIFCEKGNFSKSLKIEEVPTQLKIVKRIIKGEENM